ncbi:universal stress protein [Streptomyces fradiae]|uniref:universal stress protein n=1 Tax=Streptomyces fradiae TaxID=1906 RepID=UPI0035BE85C5
MSTLVPPMPPTPLPTADSPALAATAAAVPPPPVTALLADSVRDVAVIDTAVRLAGPRRAPLLLVVALPEHAHPPPTPEADAYAARLAMARVLPRVRRVGLEYLPVTHRGTGGGGTRLRAAGRVLDVAARHRSPVVVAATGGPPRLDARTLAEAAALRGGPFVHAVTPTGWAAPPLRLAPAGRPDGVRPVG